MQTVLTLNAPTLVATLRSRAFRRAGVCLEVGMIHAPLSEEEERIATAIVDCAYRMHMGLGPGLIESVYETCFCHELSSHGLSFKRQAPVPITYDGMLLEEKLRLDVLVEDLVIVELKSVEVMHPVYLAQILTYLKLADRRLGFLINFNVAKLKDGITRMAL